MKNYEREEVKLQEYISVKADGIVSFVRRLKPIREQSVFIPIEKKIVTNSQIDLFFEKRSYEFVNYSEEEVFVSDQKAKKKVERKYHNFVISKNSQKNLREKIAWLWRFSKSKTIKQYNGQVIPDFRVGMYTLTLPFSQKHSSAEIIEKCFSPLMTLLRNHLNMSNYVYKLEFQNNGNLHIHFLSDTYIDYFYLLKKWNEKLLPLGYIDDYQEKMKAHTLSSYLSEYAGIDGNEREVWIKRYAKGKSTNWRCPNTVDVRPVRQEKELSKYLSKYLSKKSKEGGNAKYDNESNSFGLRLCYWSQSLSRCKGEVMPVEYYPFSFELLESYKEEVEVYVYEYCRRLYWNWKKMSVYLKKQVSMFYHEYQKLFNYRPAYG